MKWLKLPTGADKPSWAGLFGCLSMIYIFVEPYQRHAPWTEWLWTGLAFTTFAVLATLAAIYWSRQRVMQQICVAIAVLAIAFTCYRSSGVFFFIFVAAFGPLAVGGSRVGSAAIILGAITCIVGGWWLLWPPSLVPYVAALEALLIGAAITFVVRQQVTLRQILKTAERERIARDLHDILGHTLSVIILKSELASRLLDQNPQRAAAEIQDVERISRSALSEVREAIAGYRDGDLRTEIDRATATLETAGITVERRCEQAELPIAQERVLALVLREAVTNVVRHARARRCRVTFHRSGSGWQLQIHDDGRGGIHQEGMGMRGIRERITEIGGTVSWAADTGTALTVTVPAEQAA